MTPAEAAASAAYAETRALLADPAIAEDVTHGLTILYGPPIQSPDLFLVSFQGGGAAPVIYDRWPERLLYLDDEFKPGNAFKFGRHLCRYAREAGLYDVLATSTVAAPAVFPGSPEKSADGWLRRTGARVRWRQHSVGWIERLVDAIQPRAVVIFGDKACQALHLRDQWRIYRRNRAGFDPVEWRGIPTLFTKHLSRPVRADVLGTFAVLRSLIGRA